MSAIKLVNQVPASDAPSAEFRLTQGAQQIARIGIAAGGSATVPTSGSWQVHESESGSVNTMGQWAVFAIVNGITTQAVTTTDPNATITLAADNNESAFSLSVS
jgi:hypothetical protein